MVASLLSLISLPVQIDVGLAPGQLECCLYPGFKYNRIVERVLKLTHLMSCFS